MDRFFHCPLPRKRPSLGWKGAFVWIVTILCLALALGLCDWRKTWHLILESDPLFLALAALLYLGSALAGGWAWVICLQALGFRLPLKPALKLTLEGYVLNNLLPGGILGDAYRLYAASQCGTLAEDLNKPSGCPDSVEPTAAGRKREALLRTAAGTILGRVTSIVALVIVTLLADVLALPSLKDITLQSSAVWPLRLLPSWMWRLDVALMLLPLLLLLGLFIGCLAVRHQAERTSSRNRKYFKLFHALRRLSRTVCRIGQHKRAFSKAVAIDACTPILEGVSLALVAASLGLELAPQLFVAFIPVLRLVAAMPFTVNSLGAQELAVILLWQPLGASPEQALGSSLIMHALRIILCLLCLPLLWSYARKAREKEG